MRYVSAIILMVLGLGVFASAVRAAEEQFPNITIDELKTAIANKQVTLLDANGSESYRAGHIPTAIDFDANSSNLEQILPADKHALIVAYCGGPQCTAYKAAATKAVALGYTNVKHLSAGISGWKNAGEKVEKVSWRNGNPAPQAQKVPARPDQTM